MRIGIIELKQKIDTKWTGTFQLFVLLSFWLKNGEQSILKNIQAESDDQNFVEQVNEEPILTNTDLCVMCKNPRNGTNWGFLNNGEVHHNYCETCKDNLDKKPGDLCPLCDSPIDLVVKKCHIELNYSCD